MHPWLQQSLGPVQAAFTPRHALPPHVPSMHDWLQHSMYVVHDAPAFPHDPLPPSGSTLPGCHAASEPQPP